MASLNAVVTAAVDTVMGPLGALPPLVSLAILALATAIVVLLVAGWTIDRRAIERAKRQMQAAIFEMRLFNDDPWAVLRAAADVLRRNVTYLRLWLLPVLGLTVPLAPLTAQIDAFYAYAGLTPGASALVTVDVADEAVGPGDAAPALSLEAPSGIDVETPAIWFPAARQAVWRVSPRTAGEFDLQVRVGGEVITKTLRVADGVGRRSPERVRPGFVNQLLYPSEPPLQGNGPVDGIAVDYPAGAVDVFGWQLPWLVPYLILTVLFAFALKGPFGVVF